MHALAEYGGMHVKLYEDIAQHGHIAATYDYPVMVNGRYMMRPSPIPKFDNPKLDQSPALMLFGAGREKRVYAVPPYTSVKSLTSRTIASPCSSGTSIASFAARTRASWTRSSWTTPARAATSARTPNIATTGRRASASRRKRHEPSGRYRRGRPSARRPRTTGEEPRPLLSVRDMTRTWDGVHGCRDVSFDLHAGEVLCVVGESGSGKSTLLSAVSCQAPLDSGSVWYDTRDQGLIDLSRCRRPACGCCRAPTGASCASMPATACVCRSAPAPTSPSA